MNGFTISAEEKMAQEGVIDAEALAHIGVIYRSGRYEWGSGEDPYQRLKDYASTNARLKKEIPNEGDRAKYLGFRTTADYRRFTSVATGEKRDMDRERAENMKRKGHSNEAIAKKLDVSATTVATLLKPREELKASARTKAAAALKAQVDARGFIDVSKGTESSMGITDTMKNSALFELKQQGYHVYNIHVPVIGGDRINKTNVLVPPGTTFKEVRGNIDKIKPYVGKIDEFSRDANPLGIEKPIAVNPKRVGIMWKEDGGATVDGMVYVRPGIEDISLGKNRYAQVRIQVGDGHYIKGVATYKNDLPKGVDLLVGSNKPKNADKLKALKELERTPTGEVDEDNPFGSIVRQLKRDGPDGPGTGEVYSAMNIVNNEDEGWDRWSKSLSSQFLSKQSLPLARTQLELTRAKRQAEFDKIMSLENPVVKKYMLEKFADNADAASQHLKATQLPGQKTHVLIPINSLKPTEVFAPNFENGDRIVLVRFPHGGTFEIPELIVNNKNKEGEGTIGLNSKAAIGIHHSVAEQLSGADFDGDTVVAIPNNHGRITTRSPLKQLEGFDTKEVYGPTKDQEALIEAGKPPYKILPKSSTNREMGVASNLLTDMQLKGANDDEVARATKHSMVVIDAAKHKLDYKRSYEENGIKALKDTYQSGGGADTLLSRARGDQPVPQRELRKYDQGGPVDAKTGELVYMPTGTKRRAKDKVTGEWYETDDPKMIRITKMEATKDAHTLSSGTAMESLYADHANAMKELGNKARLANLNTKDPKADPEAKKKYATEVAELDAALVKAHANAPRERHANRVAGALMRVRMAEHPDMDKAEIKKLSGQMLRVARDSTGASKDRIHPTEKQWEAIQAGAISASKLREILKNGDVDSIVSLAMPRETKGLTASQEARIRAMAAQNKTQAEIAAALGISTSTVSEHL